VTNPANQLLVAHLRRLETENTALREDRERQRQLILSLSATISQLEIALRRFRQTSLVARRNRVRARMQWQRAEHWKTRCLREQEAREIETGVLR
jgi:hypothetical protein